MALHAMVTAVEEEKVNKVEQEHLGMWVRFMYKSIRTWWTLQAKNTMNLVNFVKLYKPH